MLWGQLKPPNGSWCTADSTPCPAGMGPAPLEWREWYSTSQRCLASVLVTSCIKTLLPWLPLNGFWASDHQNSFIDIVGICWVPSCVPEWSLPLFCDKPERSKDTRKAEIVLSSDACISCHVLHPSLLIPYFPSGIAVTCTKLRLRLNTEVSRPSPVPLGLVPLFHASCNNRC